MFPKAYMHTRPDPETRASAEDVLEATRRLCSVAIANGDGVGCVLAQQLALLVRRYLRDYGHAASPRPASKDLMN